MTSAWLTRCSCASYNYTLAELEKVWILMHRHSRQKRQRGATFATQLDSRYRYFVCLLVKNISIYIHMYMHTRVCIHACIYKLYAKIFYAGRLRINMHMEHTFRVSGLVPGILGSLPSPRAEVQAKLASAVTRQRFIRPAHTKQEKPRCQRAKL